MITEDYVSFETAKLLKEKGFNEPCECFYDTEHNDISIVNGWMDTSNSLLEEREFLCYSAPTLQMAMKWLREVHGLWCEISWEGKGLWCMEVFSLMDEEFIPDSIVHEIKSYEEACESAIKYCLKNLI